MEGTFEVSLFEVIHKLITQIFYDWVVVAVVVVDRCRTTFAF